MREHRGTAGFMPIGLPIVIVVGIVAASTFGNSTTSLLLAGHMASGEFVVP